MTPFVYRVLAEARMVALENPDGALAYAFAQYDAHVQEATRAAHRWSTMKHDASSAVALPTSRDGSLPYVPTGPQGTSSALLSACHAAGMTETQTIEMLFREAEALRAALMKAHETAPLRFVIPTKQEKP